jgi:hypothetical protein
VFSAATSTCLNSFSFIGFPVSRNVVWERIIWIWGAQKCLNAEERILSGGSVVAHWYARTIEVGSREIHIARRKLDTVNTIQSTTS